MNNMILYIATSSIIIAIVGSLLCIKAHIILNAVADYLKNRRKGAQVKR
ncbi:MAG: hypothetical protein IJ809_02890 [Clostridia bacterium]|nr:hypothetical protein [Clostridia bacterium]